MIVDLLTHPMMYVTIPDLVRYSGLPRSTVYWHVKYGQLPVRRVGRVVRVRTDDARVWVEIYANPRHGD